MAAPDFNMSPTGPRHTYRIPENSVYLKEIKAKVFKKKNPEEVYRTLDHINSGSQGQIYRVERKSDGKILALKMVVAKN